MKNKILYGCFIPIFIIMSSCSILAAISETLIFLDSVNETIDSEEKIQIFIENKTNEAIVVFVNGYLKGAELARISKGKEEMIKITKGRTIYVSGGITQKKYREIICDADSEVYIIR
jgi:hypothetical protein